jgi:hypothetical protein
MSDETPVSETIPVLKTYTITCADKTLSAVAESIAWTENGEFVLLMDGDDIKHLFVAANIIAITEQS